MGQNVMSARIQSCRVWLEANVSLRARFFISTSTHPSHLNSCKTSDETRFSNMCDLFNPIWLRENAIIRCL